MLLQQLKGMQISQTGFVKGVTFVNKKKVYRTKKKNKEIALRFVDHVFPLSHVAKYEFW